MHGCELLNQLLNIFRLQSVGLHMDTRNSIGRGLPSAKVGAELLHIRQSLVTATGFRDGGDNLRSNYDAIGNGGHRLEVLMGTNSKAHCARSIPAIFFYASQEVREVGIQLSQGARDSLTRDDVDEGVSQLAEDLHAGVRRGGGNERDVRKTASTSEVEPCKFFFFFFFFFFFGERYDVPAGTTEPPERESLLRWEVDHDEAIDSSTLTVG